MIPKIASYPRVLYPDLTKIHAAAMANDVSPEIAAGGGVTELYIAMTMNVQKIAFHPAKH